MFLDLTLKQAIARGLKDPSSRVIQSHFAISANLGEIAAKVIYTLMFTYDRIYKALGVS